MQGPIYKWFAGPKLVTYTFKETFWERRVEEHPDSGGPGHVPLNLRTCSPNCTFADGLRETVLPEWAGVPSNHGDLHIRDRGARYVVEKPQSTYRTSPLKGEKIDRRRSHEAGDLEALFQHLAQLAGMSPTDPVEVDF